MKAKFTALIILLVIVCSVLLWAQTHVSGALDVANIWTALQTFQSIAYGVTSINNSSSPYTVAATDAFIICDATSGAVTINLPSATGTGRALRIKKSDSSANACTPTRAGSDTIDGATTVSLASQYSYTGIVDSASAKWSKMAGVGGSGTVTSFSAGTLSPVFTTSVANSTTTPALSFSLSTAAAHTFLGNNTGSTAAPAYAQLACADLSNAAASCSTDATVASNITLTTWQSPAAAGSSSMGTVAQNSTKLYGIYLPGKVVASQICYYVGVADNTANVYDVGVYNHSGTLLGHTGATAGTTLFPSTGLKCQNWSGGGNVTVSGQIELALTSSAASPTGVFGGNSSPLDLTFCDACAASSGGGTSGGALNGSLTLAADSWVAGRMPNIAFH